jgi:hypothetical protein
VLEPAPNETVEKVQFWAFHRKVPLENKGVTGTDFFGFRVFRQSQQGHAGDGEQRPLVPPIVEAILLRWYHKNTRYRYTSRERAISPAYHAQKLSPEINVVLVVGLEVFTQYGVIRH